MAAARSSARPRSKPGANASAKPPEHFGLTGRSISLDPRVNAVRSDIADIALAGVLFAPHYAAPLHRKVTTPGAGVLKAPAHDAELISELLHGEGFAVLDLSGGWAWGYCLHDHYVGYVEETALGEGGPGAWRIKAPEAAGLSMGSRLDAPSLPLGMLLGPGETADAVALAETLIGRPYLLGGRGPSGIDCSGLVQVTLGLAGIDAPRDSDMQEAALGKKLARGARLRRGDLVFFPGHVGMMLDGERLIHATGFHRAVVIEALALVIERILGDDRDGFVARRP